MSERFKFNRMEPAGSLGDLGTLLPIAIAMILVNGLDPLGLFFSVGVFYIISGVYFGITVPVRPMKVIGAIFVVLALGLGNNIVAVLKLPPMSIPGILLIFAGAQLALAIMDLDRRKDYFVAFLMLGITLASNLAAAFFIGIVVGHLLRWRRLSV